MKLEERFWKKVFIMPYDRGCWLWCAATSRKGYGQFLKGRMNTNAHRVAWEFCRGPIPEGMCVLHHCDNPRCCNPSHLFLGSNIDNNLDRDKKGRTAKGHRNGKSVLTEELVRKIRSMWVPWKHANGQRAIARKLGLNWHTVASVIGRQTWRHVP